MAISSNLRRAEMRRKCRQELAKHIKAQLGLDISPENVRLRPRRDDKYQWKVAEPLRGLFSTKDLSNGTTGEFQKICTALEGGGIEAVLVTATKEEEFLCEDKYRSLLSHDNDSLKVLERERQNDRLEFDQYREKAQQEMHDAELKWQAECQALKEQILGYKTERDLQQARVHSMGQIISPILNSLTRHLSELLDLQH
ncbi:hypothetical protein BDV12DRAFT_203053 [Aspergillus spectabilis]